MYCAKYSTTNRLVFRSASRPPFLPHYQGPQPTNAQHRISTQLPPSPPGSHSIRFADSGYSGVSAPPSAKSQPLQLDTSLMNPGISRAASTSASTTLVDHSIAGSGNASRRSSESAARYLASIATFRCKYKNVPPFPHSSHSLSRHVRVFRPTIHGLISRYEGFYSSKKRSGDRIRVNWSLTPI